MGVDNHSTWTAFVVRFAIKATSLTFAKLVRLDSGNVTNDCLAMRRLRTEIRRGDVLSDQKTLSW